MIINFDIEGYHQYPDAPEEVKFLRNEHRHLFRIKAGFQVKHNNRDKEIFIYTRKIQNYLVEKYEVPCVFHYRSCEAMAEQILTKFDCEWVEVLEDGKG